MKIFSLETKKHILLWAIGLAILINFALAHTSIGNSYLKYCGGDACAIDDNDTFGFPIKYSYLKANPGLLEYIFNANILVWIVLFFVIFSLYRRFKYKKP
jgi:hypothetical protein